MMEIQENRKQRRAVLQNTSRNRKRTKGRNISYQRISAKDGKGKHEKFLQTIKHFQQTSFQSAALKKLFQIQQDLMEKKIKQAALRRKMDEIFRNSVKEGELNFDVGPSQG